MIDKSWEIDNKIFFIISGIILLFGFVILISNLKHESIWLDENYTVMETNGSYSEILEIMKIDFHPPFYYLLVKTFRLIGGNSLFAMRLCSVFGLLSLAFLGFGSVRRIFGNKTGLLYIFFIMITPILFAMAEEARMYTWTAFFVTGSALYGYISVANNKITDWIKYGLLSIGGIYTHYYALFAIVVANLLLLIWILLKERNKFKIFFIINYIVFLCYLPWIQMFVFQISNSGSVVPPMTTNRIWLSLFTPFGDKFSYTHGILELQSYTFWIALILILFGGIKMAIKKTKGYLLNSLIFGTYVIVLSIALTVTFLYRPIFQERYIITVTGLFILSLVIGLSSIKRKSIFIGSIILLIALILPTNYLIYNERFNGPADEVVSYIKPTLTDDTIFIYFDLMDIGTFCYYFPKNTHFLYDQRIKGHKNYYIKNNDPFFKGSDIDSFIKDKKDIWIITKTDDEKCRKMYDSFVNSAALKMITKTRNFELPYSWYRVSVGQFSHESTPNTIYSLESVDGEWSYYTDIYNKGTSKVIINKKEPLKFEMGSEIIDGQRKDVALLAGTVTTDYAYGYIGMSIKPDDKAITTFKKAKGIKFKSIGDGEKYRLILCTSNVKDYNYFSKEFIAGDKVTEHIVLFNELKQEDWGNKSEFLKDFIFQIEFQTKGQPHNEVLLKIFDIVILE